MPNPVISPLHINFGEQRLSTSSEYMAFTLTNTGTDTANINISLTGNHASDFEFETSEQAFSLKPDQIKHIHIRFNPSSLGMRSSELIIKGENCN